MKPLRKGGRRPGDQLAPALTQRRLRILLTAISNELAYAKKPEPGLRWSDYEAARDWVLYAIEKRQREAIRLQKHRRRQSG